jgi:ankyrin repeat protein
MIENSFDRIYDLLESGDTKSIKEEIQNNPSFSVNDYVDEVTYLGLAVDSGNLELVKLMIENGADPDFVFKQKDISPDVIPPLLVAIDSGNLEMVKLLVEAGANVNAEFQYDDFALLVAYDNGNEDIFEYLYPLTSEAIKKRI